MRKDEQSKRMRRVRREREEHSEGMERAMAATHLTIGHKRTQAIAGSRHQSQGEPPKIAWRSSHIKSAICGYRMRRSDNPRYVSVRFVIDISDADRMTVICLRE